ncbi:MAG: proton-conducting transporter membrane subunit [Actinomycetota bacterium]|nr:proton-conducting transporter membrane subunit [Actinomycetota bacterium]
MSIFVILLLPLIATALVAIPFKRPAWAAGVTVLSSLAVLVIAVRIVRLVSAGAPITSGLKSGVLKWISVDSLSALILLLIAFIGTTAAIFSFGYMAHGNYKPWKLRLYYANYNLFLFSMLAIPVLAEPTLVWIVVELTTLASALLVSFEDTREALEASWKYVVLSLMGAGVALLGFLLLFAAMQASGSKEAYTWGGLLNAAHSMPPVLLQFAFLLILIGLGAKAGLVPMHTWLPDAHSQAPSPVCALLSGIETSVILYVILRLFPVMQAAPNSHAETWAIVLGLISAGTAAFLLMQVSDYKRMFAFSTIEHMGIILTAVGLGAAASYGAVWQIVSHSLTKSFCFFAAGAVLLSIGTRGISSVRGLMRRSPVAGAALVFGALGITGAPPLAVFLSEFSIFKAGLAQKQYVVTGLLSVFIVIAFFGIMMHVNRMVFGARESESGEAHPDNYSVPGNRFHLPFSCRLALVLAAVPVLVLGFYIPQPLQILLSQAAAVLTAK